MPPAKKKTARKKAAAAKPKAKAAGNIYAVIGSDDAKVKEEALALSRELAPAEAGEFGMDVVEGAADTVDMAVTAIGSALEALQTLPFFGGAKLVWLKGTNAFADTVAGRSDTTLAAAERLMDYLESGQIPAEVKFLISATDIDKRRTFYKRLTKIAAMQEHNRIDLRRPGSEAELLALVHQLARDRGVRFAPGAAELFAMVAGEDTRQLQGELEKLALYAAPRTELEEDDIRAVVSQNRAGAIFDIGDALARRNIRRAMELIDQLVYLGESPVAILLAAIIPKIRGLLVAKDLSERLRMRGGGSYPQFSAQLERLPDSETAHLPRTKEGKISAYPIFLALKETGGFTMDQLRAGLRHCLEANRKLVTSDLDGKLVLNQLVVKIAG